MGLNKTATCRLTLFSEVRALAACTCSGAVLHRECQWTPHSPQTPPTGQSSVWSISGHIIATIRSNALAVSEVGPLPDTPRPDITSSLHHLLYTVDPQGLSPTPLFSMHLYVLSLLWLSTYVYLSTYYFSSLLYLPIQLHVHAIVHETVTWCCGTVVPVVTCLSEHALQAFPTTLSSYCIVFTCCAGYPIHTWDLSSEDCWMIRSAPQCTYSM